jgi:hypothetical protein
MTTTPRPSDAPRESGIALIWAILIMAVVIGLVAVIALSTLSTTRQARDSASRTRATFWAEAASKDILARFASAEVGPWIASTLASGDQVLQFTASGTPTRLATPPKDRRFPIGTDTRAIKVSNTAGGTTQSGWYQLLPPIQGGAAWTGVRIMDASRPGDQGAVQFVVRAWSDQANARPTLVRIELRHSSLSRFSILSEDQLVLGGMGTLKLGGAVHTNNSHQAATAIELGGSTSVGSVRSITSTSGAINGCASSICRPNVREVVSFGSAATAMRNVQRLAAAPTNRCTGTKVVACSLVDTTVAAANRLGAWRVNLAGAGGCVDVGRITFPLRTDVGAYPMVDDRAGPASSVTGAKQYCPAPGGAAILLDADVVVVGRRAATAPPVTLMAQRPETGRTATMGSTSGIRVTAPASIYLAQSASGAGIGSSSALAPVGLVAQGGVYLPSWAMRTVNSTLSVTNVAAMAMTGEIAYGPAIQAIAADGASPGGLGIMPDDARALGYGYGSSFTFTGSLISSGRMSFRYGQGAAYLGYGQRNLAYVDSLAWNPPPLFPTDHDWYLADWTEFDQ